MNATGSRETQGLRELLKWRSLLRFLVIALGSLTVLSFLWGALAVPFSAWIRGSAEAALRFLTPGFVVEVSSDARPETDTMIELVSREPVHLGERLRVHFPMRWAAFTPIVTFLSLLLATRLRPGRRLRALAIGLLLVHLELYLRLALQAAAGVERHREHCRAFDSHGFPWNAGETVPALVESLSTASQTMVFHPLPLLIWILVVTRAGAWRGPLPSKPGVPRGERDARKEGAGA